MDCGGASLQQVVLQAVFQLCQRSFLADDEVVQLIFGTTRDLIAT